MGKLIDRKEIEELLKDIEEDMARLEEKIGSAILTVSMSKEQAVMAKGNSAADLLDNIEYTARLASSGRKWPIEGSFVLNTSFHS
ncbi:hypothetical protein J9317_11380 [Metabacillus sp. KIGAM252]|uniref:Uncharacterized protein n=1 Tax=Metabacillus flavus TaxID=2823519 RepID=A0ABS5LFA6_9BACI|nr:hypothetical protein [Metabacillus flavus]MBS2969367.1 hypothetical protein [Metabacillus flavus]